MMSKNKPYQSGSHVTYDLNAHIIFVTKYRKKCITDRVRDILIKSIKETCDRYEVILSEADGEEDHLHLLISYPPKVCLSIFVGASKTASSKKIRSLNYPEVRKQLWGKHFWSPSYFVASTGGAPLEIVAAYIRNQRENTH
jgi:putative transposase